MDEDSPRKNVGGCVRRSSPQAQQKRLALDKLAVMGFDIETAQVALAKTEWHADAAVALLRRDVGSVTSNESSTTASKSWTSYPTSEGIRPSSGPNSATRTSSGSQGGSSSACVSPPTILPMPNFAS